ncbi:MAG: hypothetical protein ACXAD7_27345 [Candidatus Kariarchaeaceae archaeon]|jgi:hypothetical protein
MVKKYYFIFILIFFLILPATTSGHGSEPVDDETDEEKEGEFGINLSLDQIYFISLLLAGLLAIVMLKLANIKDTKLVYLIFGISIVILTGDYLVFKYYVYK